jgi:Fe-S oxidoreductase
MNEETLIIGKNRKSIFKDMVMKLLPEGGNLNSCLTCGACSSGCPATGTDNMDARKFLRLAALGLDKELLSNKWAWSCTMCQRCIYVCPMKIDIPQLVFNVRQSWPRDKRPKGIQDSCDKALETVTCSAMGITPEDFRETVEEVLETIEEEQPSFSHVKAPMNKKGAHFFLNQNSREPAMEEDEMIPLWKILNLVGADWTYSDKGFAAENYCMFLADDDAWEKVVRLKAKTVDDLDCKVWLNTE